MTERKVWVYARIKEANAERLVRQMYDLLRYVSERGFDLAGNSQEVTQEQSIHRPALAAILCGLRSGDADTLLVQSLSCVTEDPVQLFEFLCAVQDCRAAVAVSVGSIHDELFTAGVGNRLLFRAARMGLPKPWLG